MNNIRRMIESLKQEILSRLYGSWTEYNIEEIQKLNIILDKLEEIESSI